jgi:catechol 2,3-dioxygenase-like lactoylglutathione lyase family enzyme
MKMKLNHITIVVSDIDRSKRFYREILGLESTFEEEISGGQFSEVTATPGLRLRFAVLRARNSDIIIELAQFLNPQTEINSDFRHIAFEVDDVDEVHLMLKNKGIETLSEPVTISGSHPKINGKRFFYFRDPDGNLIELFNSRKSLYSN